MFYKSLIETARRMTCNNMETLPSGQAWLAALPLRRRRWHEMLGIADRQRCDLAAEQTGQLERDGYIVEKFHYQPLPDCRVAANLYRPADIPADTKLPAILYVCGHSKEAKAYRNYQGNGRWFAQHGYICMVIDTIWAGESVGLHHGVYNSLRFDWISRGYSPAATEVWSAMRALDYLQSRSDVDPELLGMTGNSGGGGISWFTAAADERIKVIAPSCQTASTRCHITHRLQDSHCDCTYWPNTAGWSFSEMAALLAPRPLMIASQSRDMLFRPYGYREVYMNARRVYELLGVEDNIKLQEDHHEHGYTARQRVAIYNWFDKHLKCIENPQAEDWDDYVEPIDNLNVFPDGKVPDSDRMKDVGDFFIEPPKTPKLIEDRGEFEKFRKQRIEKLRSTTFARIPAVIDAPTEIKLEYCGREAGLDTTVITFQSEQYVDVRVTLVEPVEPKSPDHLLAVALGMHENAGLSPYRWDKKLGSYAIIQPRCTHDHSVGPKLLWSIRRGYMLMGLSLYERQVYDTLTAIAAIRSLRNYAHIELYGYKDNAAIAAYAAILDEKVDSLLLQNPQMTHLDPKGPEFPSIARTGDLNINLALMAPRPVRFVSQTPPEAEYLQFQYEKFGVAKTSNAENITRLLGGIFES